MRRLRAGVSGIGNFCAGRFAGKMGSFTERNAKYFGR